MLQWCRFACERSQQVSFEPLAINVPNSCVCSICWSVSEWFVKLYVTNAPVTDVVCSKHFTKEDYIQLVLNNFKSCSVASTSIDGRLCVHDSPICLVFASISFIMLNRPREELMVCSCGDRT